MNHGHVHIDLTDRVIMVLSFTNADVVSTDKIRKHIVGYIYEWNLEQRELHRIRAFWNDIEIKLNVLVGERVIHLRTGFEGVVTEVFKVGEDVVEVFLVRMDNTNLWRNVWFVYAAGFWE